MDGNVRREWSPDGLRCTIEIPSGDGWRISGRTNEEEIEPVSEAPEPAGAVASLRNRRVLVVEDEALVAAGLQRDFRAAGCEPVGPVATPEAGLALLHENVALDAAFVDLNLNGKTSRPVIDALIARSVPFCVTTGYADASASLPEGTPVLEKPYSTPDLHQALTNILTANVLVHASQ